MSKSDLIRWLKAFFLVTLPKALFLYVLVPLLCLVFLAEPVRSAVRASDAAVFRILLAFMCAVGLNWLVYKIVRRKRPSLLVYAYGTFFLLLVSLIQYGALPGFYPMTSTLSYVCAFFALVFLFLLSYWFAMRNTRPSHTAAVILRILLGFIFWGVFYQIYREIESGNMTRDTWITIGFMVALLFGFNIPRFLPRYRLARERRRKTGQASGTIVQVIGETYLDRDENLATRDLLRIEYTVNDTVYETRLPVRRITVRRHGKAAFIGREIPVFYDPQNPDDAFVERISKHFFEDQPQDRADEDLPESENSDL